jgi:hypothetical protein
MTGWPGRNEETDEVVAAFMVRVASLPVTFRVQDPLRLWWKAQLLRKWDAERRAQLPLDAMQSIELAGGLVAAGLMLYWSLPYLR